MAFQFLETLGIPGTNFFEPILSRSCRAFPGFSQSFPLAMELHFAPGELYQVRRPLPRTGNTIDFLDQIRWKLN